MSIEVQEEAKRLIEARMRELAILDATLKIGAIVSGVFIPYASTILNAIRVGSKHFVNLSGDKYLEELEKAARGERDSLPEPPDVDYGGAFLGAC